MPPAATTSCCRACAERSGRAACSSRWSTRPPTAPTPWRGCVEQPWFTGRFATIGVSYLGFTQWALLQDPPPELAAAVITAGPHDIQRLGVGHRLVRRQRLPGLERHGRPPGGPGAHPGRHPPDCGPRRTVARAAAELPMGAAAGRCSARARRGSNRGSNTPTPTIRSGSGCGTPPRWTACEVPVLLLGGWQDIFLQPDAAAVPAPARPRRRRRADDGPVDTHPAAHQGAGHQRPGIAGLAGHPSGRRAGRQRPSTVRVFVTGQGWRNLPDWPPATTDRALYLQPGGRLGETAPDAGGRHRRHSAMTPPTRRPPPAVRCCPPTAVTATTAGSRCGADVLGFTGATLTHDLYVYGNPVVELAHTSDNPARRPVRPGQRGRQPTAGPAMSATATGGWAPSQTARKPSASSSTASPTASGRAHASAS